MWIQWLFFMVKFLVVYKYYAYLIIFWQFLFFFVLVLLDSFNLYATQNQVIIKFSIFCFFEIFISEICLWTVWSVCMFFLMISPSTFRGIFFNLMKILLKLTKWIDNVCYLETIYILQIVSMVVGAWVVKTLLFFSFSTILYDNLKINFALNIWGHWCPEPFFNIADFRQLCSLRLLGREKSNGMLRDSNPESLREPNRANRLPLKIN